MRKQKTLTFLELNDGSSLSSCQVVVDHASLPEEIVKEAQSLQTGSSISVLGALKESSGSKQKYDFQLSSMKLLGACPPEEYPLAKKRHSLEYLRTLAHIRPRTNTVAAVARVRSKLAQSIHRFFEKEEVRSGAASRREKGTLQLNLTTPNQLSTVLSRQYACCYCIRLRRRGRDVQGHNLKP